MFARFAPVAGVTLTLAGTLFFNPATADAVDPGPGYSVHHTIPGGGNLGMTLENPQTLTGAFSKFEFFDNETFESDTSIEIKQVDLPTGPIGPVIANHPTTTAGDAQSTFPNRFAASNGTHVLTGATGNFSAGSTTPGDLFLTDLSSGSTTNLALDGNFDGTASNGRFFVTAAAGTDTGLSSDGASGLFHVEQDAGTLNGANLLLDTGAPSGSVAGNGDGDLFFNLGGPSAELSAQTRTFMRVQANDVDTAITNGTTLDASNVDTVLSGADFDAAAAPFFVDVFDSFNGPFISDLLVSDSRMFISATGFNDDFSESAGLVLEFALTGNSDDLSADLVGTRAFNRSSGTGSLAFDATNDLLWISSGGDLTAVPEPTTLALLGLGGLALVRRRR